MTEPERKEGFVARHRRLAREIRDEPTVVVPWARGAFARLWAAKGGGFYGLGYVIVFIMLEVRTFGGSLVGSGGVSAFVSGIVVDQALHYVLRVSFESLLNAFLALLWPVHVLGWLGPWGIVVLVGGYVGFEHALRPLVEGTFPELEAARTAAREQRAKRKFAA